MIVPPAQASISRLGTLTSARADPGVTKDNVNSLIGYDNAAGIGNVRHQASLVRRNILR